jgi:hypothetical protein
MARKGKPERDAFLARVRENNRKLLEVARKAQLELERRKAREQ